MIFNKKEYTPKHILALAAAIQKDARAADWLKFNRPELYLTYRVVAFHDYAACDELKSMNFNSTYMFAVAFLEDFQTSIDYFVRNKEMLWAAVLDACRDNSDALVWLGKKNMPYKILATSILEYYRWNMNGDDYL
jgi:hypothetical protein